MTQKNHSKNKLTGKEFFQALGPGVITGASDDDPSGITTYTQAGARFGMGMLWTMFFSFPLMSAIQEISVHIGRVSGHGIAGNLRRYYSKWLLYGAVFLLLIANTINLGADIGAMSACLQLLIGGSSFTYVVLFTIISLLLQVFIPYTKYVNYLKWLTFSLFAYIATAFFIHISWMEAFKFTFLPSFSFGRDELTMLVAILGTTISPYLFFWQASEEVEELECEKEKPVREVPEKATSQFLRIKIDTYVGMFFLISLLTLLF